MENNVVPDVGADGVTVTIGNVYTWFFTIYGWGMDYGVSDGWGSFPAFDNPMEGVDRTAASETLALICADEELIDAAIENAAEELFAFYEYFCWPESTQQEIDDSLAALLEAMDSEPAEPVEGDVNGDGEVDISDALAVLRHAMQLEELDDAGIASADVNGDGAVDLSDALIILRMAMGLV